MLELNQTELKEVNGGCACYCTCYRDGSGGSTTFMGNMEIGACLQTCSSLSHGGRHCSANCY